jgi:hypothetical protein
MSGHRWAGNWDEGGGRDLEVRHVQPYEAVKTYRCPGCDHEIPPGQGHEVVVPLATPAERRHWHTGCWRRVAHRH